MQFCTRNLALHLVKQLSSRVLELHQNQAAPRSKLVLEAKNLLPVSVKLVVTSKVSYM